MKHCQMHPNTTRRTKTWVYGPMGWIGSYHCEKFQFDFMARTCALIALVQPVLQRVLCTNETLPNATKYNMMHQNMSLGSNAVDRVCSLRKIPMRLYGTNLCINCTSSTRFAPSWQMHPNTRKNTPKHEFRVQWGGSRAFIAKNSDASSWHELLQ